MKHTPGLVTVETAYKKHALCAGGQSIAHCYNWFDNDGTIIGSDGNAAHLALCWNMHDELVAALQKSANVLAAVSDILAGGALWEAAAMSGRAYSEARAVLAKLSASS